jgi:hypothetical protein
MRTIFAMQNIFFLITTNCLQRIYSGCFEGEKKLMFFSSKNTKSIHTGIKQFLIRQPDLTMLKQRWRKVQNKP